MANPKTKAGVHRGLSDTLSRILSRNKTAGIPVELTNNPLPVPNPDVLIVQKSRGMREYPGDPLPDRVQHVEDIDTILDKAKAAIRDAFFVPTHLRESYLGDMDRMLKSIRSYA